MKKKITWFLAVKEKRKIRKPMVVFPQAVGLFPKVSAGRSGFLMLYHNVS